MKNDFSDLSKQITNNISKEDKKKNGIYFTPITTIKINLELLKPFISKINSVLEPSCGSCEFLLQLSNSYPHLQLTGIEKNESIYHSIKHLANKNIVIINDDFLKFNEKKKYDLIIGNPPYFVIKKECVSTTYSAYYEGRPNIFILFIIKSMNLLNVNGILSFVLPKNFLNCLYYNKTREYICRDYSILCLKECDDTYIDTLQSTVIMILKKTKDVSNLNDQFVLKKNNHTIFALPESIIKLKSLYESSKTLSQLDFKITIGNIVWNQNKKILTTDSEKTLLIYNSDIKDNNLQIQTYKNAEKKNFINKPGKTKPMLVVNRGYGTGNYKFEYCLITGNKEYLIENHLICIEYNKSISNDKLLILYKQLISSFNNKKTDDFIKLYFQNNAINANELKYILPIYDIQF